MCVKLFMNTLKKERQKGLKMFVWSVLKKKYFSSTCLETAFIYFDDSLPFTVSTATVGEFSLGSSLNGPRITTSNFTIRDELRSVLMRKICMNLHLNQSKRRTKTKYMLASNLSEATVFIQNSDSTIDCLQQPTFHC